MVKQIIRSQTQPGKVIVILGIGNALGVEISAELKNYYHLFNKDIDDNQILLCYNQTRRHLCTSIRYYQ